jgi:hypothetical protein
MYAYKKHPKTDRRKKAKDRGRLRKTMEMSSDKLKRVRKILGANTDTEAVDQALELIIANHEIDQAIDEVFGKLPDFDLK